MVAPRQSMVYYNHRVFIGQIAFVDSPTSEPALPLFILHADHIVSAPHKVGPMPLHLLQGQSLKSVHPKKSLTNSG